MVRIRPATEEDARTIWRLVRAERLDPTGIHWRRFLVAEVDGQVGGIGQVREHRGARELGSLVVVPEYRGQGIAAQLIAALEDTGGYPLYLFCKEPMESFYNRFGYQSVPLRRLPPGLRPKAAAIVLLRLFGMRNRAMRKDGQPRSGVPSA